MIVTVEEVIVNASGELQPIRVSVRADRFNCTAIEYDKDKATLVVSVGQHAIVVRVPITQAAYLRKLETKLTNDVNEKLANV